MLPMFHSHHSGYIALPAQALECQDRIFHVMMKLSCLTARASQAAQKDIARGTTACSS